MKEHAITRAQVTALLITWMSIQSLADDASLAAKQATSSIAPRWTYVGEEPQRTSNPGDTGFYQSLTGHPTMKLHPGGRVEFTTSDYNFWGTYTEENSELRLTFVVESHRFNNGIYLDGGVELYSPARYAELRGEETARMRTLGRNIYVSILVYDDPVGGKTYWPRFGTNQSNHEFTTSTAFFEGALKDGILNNRTPFRQSDTPGEPADWCIVAGVEDSTPDGVPVIFTANLDVQSTDDFREPLRQLLSQHPSPTTTNTEVVIVTFRGIAMTLTPDQLDLPGTELFVLPEKPLKVLRP